MKKSLLIISCSLKKDKAPGKLPALWRYKGPFYLTLHKIIRENQWPKYLDVLIISAKYGLLKSDDLIEDYDRKMDGPRANELRPQVQADLNAFLNGKHYDQLFNGLWKVYDKTLEGFDLEKYCEHLIPVETNRGKKRQQMKRWIIELFEKEQMDDHDSNEILSDGEIPGPPNSGNSEDY